MNLDFWLSQRTAFFKAVGSKINEEEIRLQDDISEKFLDYQYLTRLSVTGISTSPDRALGFLEENKIYSYCYIISRTKYFDSEIETIIKNDKIEQIIIMGAGFDSRPYRSKQKGITYFELDKVNIINMKKLKVEKAFGKEPSNVFYLDYNIDINDLEKTLEGHPEFDKDKKTLIVIEGVLHYLSANGVNKLFKSINNLFNKGTKIMYDYILESEIGERVMCRFGVMAFFNTRFVFGVLKGAEEKFIELKGFKVISHIKRNELQEKYMKKNDGTYYGEIQRDFGIIHAELI